MDKVNKKRRDIKFFSEKNQLLKVVHTEDARCYAKYLEDREEVVGYDVCVSLDAGALDRIDKIDIRGDYFKQQWERLW